MSKGQNVPKGVSYYSHQPMSDKGKNHPTDIGPGMQTVKKVSKGSMDELSPGASSMQMSQPARKLDGKDPRGSNPTTMQAKVKAPGASRLKDNIPGGVSKHNGINVPRKVR